MKQNNSSKQTEVPVVIIKKQHHVLFILKNIVLIFFIIFASVVLINSNLEGFVKGFGIKKGAIASTIAHDSHNFICAGANDEDIIFAINLLKKTEGGITVVNNQKVLAHLPLPLAGLISLQTAEEVMHIEKEIHQAIQELGDPINNPFMYLSFLALPVIPHLKLTDKGLVDVDKFCFIPLFD